MSGVLHVVGTPIGNLEDITMRALRVLGEVDLIAAEDTRQTRKLLSHFDIHSPLVAVHEHNEAHRAEALVQRLLAGTNIAYVTDAGMPVISDPGEKLVAAALAAGVAVVPIPGPSAVLTALVVSGLPAGRFVFEGFLVRRGRERRQQMERLRTETRAVVLFEAPGRVLATLKDLAEVVGNRPLAAARELTKKFEEVRRGTAAQLVAHFEQHPPRGEFTLVLAEWAADGAPPADAETLAGVPADLVAAVRQLESVGVDRKEAMKRVAAAAGVGRRDVYNALLEEQ